MTSPPPEPRPAARATHPAVRSGAIQLAGTFVEFVALLGSGVIVTRLLEPAEFGVFTMVVSLTGVVDNFSDLGLNYATVQRRGLSHAQLSALFWISARFNVVVFGLMALAGPLLARFYGERALLLMTGVAALAAFARGLSSQHESQMMRDMRFGRLKGVELTAVVSGAIVAVSMAAAGMGAWSLVAQLVITSVTRSVGLWMLSSWRPLPYHASREALASVRPMLHYGLNFSGYRVLSYVGSQLDRVLLGRFAGATALGYYGSAARWVLYPVDMVTNPLTGVAVAGLSEYGPDNPEYRSALRRALTPFFAVLVPGIAFAMLQSDTLVVKVFGAQWAPSVPIFRILSFATLMLALERVGKWIYLSSGDTHRQFRWTLVSTPVLAAGVIAGLAYGPIGVATGYAAASTLLAIPGLAYCLRPSMVRVADVLEPLIHPLISSLVAAGVTFAVRGVDLAGLDELVIRAVVFVAAYAMTWVILPGGRRTGAEMLRLVRSLAPKRETA